MKETLQREQIIEALDRAAVFVTDSDTTFAELLADAVESGEGMFSVVDAIEVAVKDLLGRLQYPDPDDICFHFEILPPFPDAYVPNEDVLVIVARGSDGKCLTLHKDRFGEWRMGKVFPLEEADDAVEMVKDLINTIMLHG